MDAKNKGQLATSCLANVTPFVLLIGLGAHSLFEGIAMGIETDAKNVGIIALAIFLHKGVAAMSLGISLTKNFPNRDTFVLLLMAAFASFTPIGIGIGMAIAESSDIVEVVFNCLAAGTFIFIACSEVIIEEFSLPEYKVLKLIFFLIGIGMITSLLFLDA